MKEMDSKVNYRADYDGATVKCSALALLATPEEPSLGSPHATSALARLGSRPPGC